MDKSKVGKIRASAEAHFAECRDIADFMGANPEVGLDNHMAADRIADLLEPKGYAVEKDFKGVKSAFRAVKGEKSMPAAALLVETDALPEIGHACGHSISAAASILAAFIVEDVFPDIPFRVDLIGTPGEEYPGGKVLLCREHAFDDYKFAIMTHMGCETLPDSGFLACNDRHITFRGKASHASDAPEKGINALNAARLYMEAMDMRRQHLPELSQLHGIVEYGGSAPNVVPDRTELNYYYRAKTMKRLNELTAMSDDAVKGACLMTGATAEQEQRYETYADLYRNPVGRKVMCDAFEALGIEYSVSEAFDGSSDIGNVDQIIPCFHPYMAITDENIAVHTPRFEELTHCESGYKGLADAAMSMAAVIGSLGEDAGLLEELTRVHREYREANR
ncbi:MAG: M20/M25/M40 family metallo-hydrolase [Anaerovoracaceae bacterium]|nr:M20/M25/M40 family metallo-hydrolase [Anaerovoracaceae bacterium]